MQKFLEKSSRVFSPSNLQKHRTYWRNPGYQYAHWDPANEGLGCVAGALGDGIGRAISECHGACRFSGRTRH